MFGRGHFKPMPEKFRQLETGILGVFAKHNVYFSSVAHTKLAYDIVTLGWDTVKYLANNYSPSQLGRMGYLGVRRLAQLKRDNPQVFQKVMQELEEVIKNV